MLTKITERQTFMANVSKFDFSSKNKLINYICSKLDEQMIIVPTTENFSVAPVQFIPILIYIASQVEQKAKNCEDQKSMPWLISVFPIPHLK